MPEYIFFITIGFIIGVTFVVVIKAKGRPRASGVPKYRNKPEPPIKRSETKNPLSPNKAHQPTVDNTGNPPEKTSIWDLFEDTPEEISRRDRLCTMKEAEELLKYFKTVEQLKYKRAEFKRLQALDPDQSEKFEQDISRLNSALKELGLAWDSCIDPRGSFKPDTNAYLYRGKKQPPPPPAPPPARTIKNSL